MGYYLRLYKYYLAMAFKSRLSYRFDAVVGIFAFFLNNAISLIVLLLTLQNINTLAGWTFMNIAFLYGCLLIPKGIDHVFTDAIWQIGNRYVILGKFDQYLIRPVNVLFQVIAEYFQQEGLGEVILGIVLICISLPYQNINWTFMSILLLIICEFFAIFVFTSIKLLTATVAFWTKRSIQLMTTIYDISSFVRYPLKALGNFVKIIMFYIVPFGLVIYWPIESLFNGESLLIPTVVVISVSSGLFVVAYRFWLIGLKRYDGSGA